MSILQKCNVAKCAKWIDLKTGRCGSLKSGRPGVHVGCKQDFCIDHIRELRVGDSVYNVCQTCEMVHQPVKKEGLHVCH